MSGPDRPFTRPVVWAVQGRPIVVLHLSEKYKNTVYTEINQLDTAYEISNDIIVADDIILDRFLKREFI